MSLNRMLVEFCWTLDRVYSMKGAFWRWFFMVIRNLTRQNRRNLWLRFHQVQINRFSKWRLFAFCFFILATRQKKQVVYYRIWLSYHACDWLPDKHVRLSCRKYSSRQTTMKMQISRICYFHLLPFLSLLLWWALRRHCWDWFSRYS